MDSPNQVTVSEVQGEQVTVLELKVAASDWERSSANRAEMRDPSAPSWCCWGMKPNRWFTLEILRNLKLVTIARLLRARGNKGSWPLFRSPANPIV